MSKVKKKTRIVILGAGFGGVYTYKRLHRHFHGRRDIEITVVNDVNYFLFTPLLHEVATGNQTPSNIIHPIRNILKCCKSKFYLAFVESIDFKKKIVKTSTLDLPYDYVVVALGSETNFFDTKGAKEFAYPLKTMKHAVALKDRLLHCIEHATDVKNEKKRDALLSFVVVGGGPTGVELACEMSEFFYTTMRKFYPDKNVIKRIKIALVQKPDHLLKGFPKGFSSFALKTLKKHRVDVRMGHAVKEVQEDVVVLSNGEKIPSSTVVWSSGVMGKELDSPGLDRRRGKFEVNANLQVLNASGAYSLGDISTGLSVPVTAQVASKQAECVASNIIAEIEGRDLHPFLYHHAGYLVSLGRFNAVAKVGPFFLTGPFAWWLWRTIYLFKMISWNKRFKVAVDWTINLFSPRDISQL